MPELTFQNIVFDIQSFIANYTEDSRIKRIGLFGSVSRRENNTDSDIDIITEYDFKGVFNFNDYEKYCAFCIALKESFELFYKRNVDVVDKGSLFNDENVCLDDINRDVIWIYEN
jgi:predicted nucleotidyltransferase